MKILLMIFIILTFVPITTAVEFTGMVDMSEPIVIYNENVWMHNAIFNGDTYIRLGNCTLNATNCTFSNLGWNESGK